MQYIKLSGLMLVALSMANCKKESASLGGGTPSGSSCATECSYTPAGGEEVATIPKSVQGTYKLVYQFAESGSIFSNGTKATAVLSDKTLYIQADEFDCITLKNPVFRGTDNYLFKDNCRDNITYNVSANSDGTFAEINIEPMGQGFYGQFAKE